MKGIKNIIAYLFKIDYKFKVAMRKFEAVGDKKKGS